jgi:hypothetical protein
MYYPSFFCVKKFAGLKMFSEIDFIQHVHTFKLHEAKKREWQQL